MVTPKFCVSLAIAAILVSLKARYLQKPCLGMEDGDKAVGTGQLLHLPLRVTPGMAAMKQRRVKRPRS